VPMQQPTQLRELRTFCAQPNYLSRTKKELETHLLARSGHEQSRALSFIEARDGY